jgi:hypothetical protein
LLHLDPGVVRPLEILLEFGLTYLVKWMSLAPRIWRMSSQRQRVDP